MITLFKCPRSTSSSLALSRRLKLDHICSKIQLVCDRGLCWPLLSLLNPVIVLHLFSMLHGLAFLSNLLLVHALGQLQLLPLCFFIRRHELNLDWLNCLFYQKLSSFEHFEVITDKNVVILIDFEET